MSGDSQRPRLAIALGAAVLLAGIIIIIVSTRGSEEPSGLLTSTCFEAWNENGAVLIQDGQHAYSAHGYRQTLVTRLDPDAEIIETADDDAAPDDPDARCAVIFATPQPDFEPDFGVRVFDEGKWTGLALSDKLPVEEIAALQAEAVAESNAVLVANGQLEAG